MSFVCPECQKELNTEGGLKRHMTVLHGGYTDEQAIGAGVSSVRQEAKSILGDDSLDSVAGVAPSDDSSTGQDSGKQPRKKTSKEDAAAALRQKEAFERIGRVILRKVARIPYSLWAAVMQSQEFDLTKEEQEELTGAYLEVAKGVNLDFSNPKWAFFAVIAINAELVAKRLPKMGVNIEQFTQEEER